MNLDSNRADRWLHMAAGALLAGLCLWAPPVVVALVVPLLVGWIRETEQQRGGRLAHPSMFWRWSSHHVDEWLQWGIGAATVTACYAGWRFLS